MRNNTVKNEFEKMSEEEFENAIRKASKEVAQFGNKIMLPFLRSYDNLKKSVEALEASKFTSFKKAKTAFETAKKSRKSLADDTLRAKAFKAFELCYADIEIYEKAAEMKQQYDQLCEQHNLDMKT